MTGTALVIGGTGQFGSAVVDLLAPAGWSVTVLSRGRRQSRWTASAGVRWIHGDRSDDDVLRAAVRGGRDLVVDCIGGTPTESGQLRALAGDIGTVVAVSTSAVYADEDGATWETAATGRPPRFDRPLSEQDRTVAPGEDSYAGRRRAFELDLLEQDAFDVTVLRPGAVYGPGSVFLPEWYLIRRALDGRRTVVLAHAGRTRWHGTSVDNLAALAVHVAGLPGRRVLNAADPLAPTVGEIALLVADAVGHRFEHVLLDGDAMGDVGRSPWSASPYGLVLDTSAATGLGYVPPVDHRQALHAAVASVWARAGAAEFAMLRTFDPFGHHDYPAEDRWLAGRAAHRVLRSTAT